jgi:hypothetical protein
MKKLILAIAILACFIFNMVPVVWSEEEPIQTAEVRVAAQQANPGVVAPTQPKIPEYQCPPGWVIKAGSFQNNQYTSCVPAKPAPIKCPPKTVYFQKDCVVGCAPVVK